MSSVEFDCGTSRVIIQHSMTGTNRNLHLTQLAEDRNEPPTFFVTVVEYMNQILQGYQYLRT